MLHLSLPIDDVSETRDFYERILGCRIGRERDGWFDVWFFGLQLTLHRRPDEVRPAPRQGVRHFGVALPTLAEFDALVERIDAAGYAWISRPRAHGDEALSGKRAGKLADPAGNVIEIKFYAEPGDFPG